MLDLANRFWNHSVWSFSVGVLEMSLLYPQTVSHRHVHMALNPQARVRLRDLDPFKCLSLTRLWEYGLRLTEVRFLIVIFAALFSNSSKLLWIKPICLGSLSVGGSAGASPPNPECCFDLPLSALSIPFLNYHLMIYTLLGWGPKLSSLFPYP